MSIFSEELKKLVKQKKAVVYDMAKKCQIDHSSLYQIINGKRLPASESVVKQIGEYLKLSPDVQEQLLEKYRIMHMGEETYFRRQYVKEFIEKLDIQEQDPFPVNYQAVLPDIEEEADCISVTGRENLDRAMSKIIMNEANEKGKIRIICQGTYTFLFSLLCMYGENKDFTAEHILCLENVQENNDCYNIQMLCGVAPLLKANFSYIPYYFYDSVQAHYGMMSLFPCMILGSREALLFSADGSRGLLFRGDSFLALLRETFELCKKNARPLLANGADVERVKEIADEGMNNPDFQEASAAYILCPCVYFGHLCDSGMWLKILKKDIPNRKELETFLKGDNAKLSSMVHHIKIYSFFTREGIRDFLENGHIVDPFSIYCDPLPMEDRLQCLRKVLKEIEEDRMEIYLLKEHKIKMDRDFYIVATPGLLNCVLRKKSGEYAMMTIRESTLYHAIGDFMSVLKDSDMVEGKEETAEYLRKVLQKKCTEEKGAER